MNELVKTIDDSSVISVDPNEDGEPDESLFGTNSDNTLMVSNSSDTHMEDATKATSCIDRTSVDNNEEYEHFEDNQSRSVLELPKPTIYKKHAHFLSEMKGVTFVL